MRGVRQWVGTASATACQSTSLGLRSSFSSCRFERLHRAVASAFKPSFPIGFPLRSSFCSFGTLPSHLASPGLATPASPILFLDRIRSERFGTLPRFFASVVAP
eukprot:3799301-Rhodomonas_salina.1